MPKPHGTYQRVKRQENLRHKANCDKSNISLKNKPEIVRDIDAIHRKMAVVQDWITNGALSSKTKEDEIRESISKGIDIIQKNLETSQTLKQLEQVIGQPISPILNTDVTRLPNGDLMVLAILLCKIFSALLNINSVKAK